MTNWYWPTSNLAARGVSCVPYGNGLVVADWTTPRIFPFNPGVGFSAANVFSTDLTAGFSQAVPDGSGGVFLFSYVGPAWRKPAPGNAIAGFTPPTGRSYVGGTFVAGSGLALASTGEVWNLFPGSGMIGTWATQAAAIAASGTTILSLLSSTLALGTMTTAGVTGSVALPTASIGYPSCIAASANLVVVGGWIDRTPLVGSQCGALHPTNPAVMLVGGANNAMIFNASSPYGDDWALSYTLTGLSSPLSIAWRPDGIQALSVNTSKTSVAVLGYSASVLSLLQIVLVTSGCSVAVASTSIDAVVAQSGLSQVTPMVYTTSWATGAPVTGLPGVTSVTSFGPSGVIAAVNNGFAFLGLIAGTWSLIRTQALSFTPTAITVDNLLRIYAAGSGQLAIYSGTTLVGSGTWAGSSPSGIVAHDGRVVMSIVPDLKLRVFGQSDIGLWSEQNSVPITFGTPTLSLTTTNVWTHAAGGTILYSFSGTPFQLTRVSRGAIVSWNGVTWTTFPLSGSTVGHNFSSVAFGPSGDLWLSTTQNNYWNVTTNGVYISSGAIPVFPNQQQTTVLGMTAICPASGNVYVASSLAGVLTQL
jgi:hypothetical protein